MAMTTRANLRCRYSLIEQIPVVLRSAVVAMMQATQAGPRNNSGLSITHSDGSTECSFFVQPQVRSVRRGLEVESHANHCEPLNPNVGKYSRELGTGAVPVLDGVLDPGLRRFLLSPSI
jgi:hypothetical protein